MQCARVGSILYFTTNSDSTKGELSQFLIKHRWELITSMSEILREKIQTTSSLIFHSDSPETKKEYSLMLETTGLCPFHETCETRRDLMRFEKRLLKERREFYFDASYLERVEYSTFMSDYQRSFLSITRIQERCSSNSRRCLRFWQKVRLENKNEMSGQPSHDWITQVATG